MCVGGGTSWGLSWMEGHLWGGWEGWKGIFGVGGRGNPIGKDTELGLRTVGSEVAGQPQRAGLGWEKGR